MNFLSVGFTQWASYWLAKRLGTIYWLTASDIRLGSCSFLFIDFLSQMVLEAAIKSFLQPELLYYNYYFFREIAESHAQTQTRKDAVQEKKNRYI